MQEPRRGRSDRPRRLRGPVPRSSRRSGQRDPAGHETQLLRAELALHGAAQRRAVDLDPGEQIRPVQRRVPFANQEVFEWKGVLGLVERSLREKERVGDAISTPISMSLPQARELRRAELAEDEHDVHVGVGRVELAARRAAVGRRGEQAIADRRRVVDAAIDAGTTLFDTSPMYGNAQDVLARAVDGRREKVLIADKVWASSAGEAREQIRRSMDWYGGRVDIYQIHNLVAWREHLPVLEDLRDRGSVGVVGATHYAHSALKDLMAVMRTARLGMVQIPYNAGDRFVEREVLPLAHELRLGVLAMQPLGTGALVRRSPPAKDLARLEKFGVRTWTQALLKWILSDSRVSAVLPATSSADHAIENARAGDPPWFDDEAREYVAKLTSMS